MEGGRAQGTVVVAVSRSGSQVQVHEQCPPHPNRPRGHPGESDHHNTPFALASHTQSFAGLFPSVITWPPRSQAHTPLGGYQVACGRVPFSREKIFPHDTCRQSYRIVPLFSFSYRGRPGYVLNDAAP